MSEFIVHGIPGSPFLRGVLATLEEKSARYRLHALAPGEQRTLRFSLCRIFLRNPRTD